jgi:lipopolysaccharide transport system ATP-binding protein
LREGTRLGIIGRNGAGKSTLLKILSRITEPSAGRIEIYGRTASLLEIGTGFHPELTGRENIYLNGALLGMGRAEVRRKLDQIVDFAEMEKFLDDPVKHYSSGMYIRLAFSIAAHVDPDILILDGFSPWATSFPRKCFRENGRVGAKARSIILVSHDLAAVASLCNQCIVLDAGRIASTERPLKGSPGTMQP